ncbi:MAG: amidophosphoribosyltransferase, partial [Geitlerinemataceae cyanobacterium]
MMPNPSLSPEPFTHSDKPQEACGVFGVYAPSEEVSTLTYFGLYALQHRGQESAGIVTFDNGKSHVHKGMGLVSQVFNESLLDELPGTLAIGHTRYSTTGSSHVGNAQPILVETRLGTLALAHNGNLVNVVQLREELHRRKCDFNMTSDSEAIAVAIASEVDGGKDWVEATLSALPLCQGAYSLTIATPNGIM